MMSKGVNLFTTLIISLIISIIVSAGVLYVAIPIVYPSNVNSKGPTIYSLSHDDIIDLDGISTIDYLNEIDLTYSAQAGDRVLIEFNCEIYVNPIGGTDLSLRFDINGSIFPLSRIHVYTESDLFTTGYMRHYIESSTAAGNYTVNIYADISDEYTGSYIRYCFVTVTVY
jgi:hypothetical protein